MSGSEDDNESVIIGVFEKIIETQKEQLDKKDIKIKKLEEENRKLTKVLYDIKKSYVKLSEKRRKDKGMKKEVENPTISHIRALLNETPKADTEKEEISKAVIFEDKIIDSDIETFGTELNPYKDTIEFLSYTNNDYPFKVKKIKSNETEGIMIESTVQCIHNTKYHEFKAYSYPNEFDNLCEDMYVIISKKDDTNMWARARSTSTVNSKAGTIACSHGDKCTSILCTFYHPNGFIDKLKQKCLFDNSEFTRPKKAFDKKDFIKSKLSTSRTGVTRQPTRKEQKKDKSS
tara:strand:+ start:597 stop:1463 length:867 start_codon:yes stop_codon:yes gene_type:complete